MDSNLIGRSLLILAVQMFATGQPMSAMAGTSDGAGGNGIANKAYESFIQNPRELRAFALISPILKNLDQTFRATIFPKTASIFLTSKTWYLIPSALKPINPGLVGFGMLRSESEQLARQDDRKIVIDATRFKRMSLQAEADLMLHEFVETRYLLKFKSLTEICEAVLRASNGPLIGCQNPQSPELSSIFMPEETRDLNKADYENIQREVVWLKQHIERATPQDVQDSFSSNDFDHRWWQNGDGH